MILATRTGDRQLRSGEWGSSAIPPYSGYGDLSHAGENVTLESASGIPAVSLAIRRIAWSVAAHYLGVFQGRGADRRERDESWQGQLFRQPSAELSRFNWKADLIASVEACGNACAQKIKTPKGRIVELRPLDMNCVRIRKDRDGRKVFDVAEKESDGRVANHTYTENEILHLRGFTLKGGIVGHSPIAIHRHTLGSHLARDRFEGRYFKNHAQPKIVVSFPQGITKAQGDQWKDSFTQDHGGDNIWKPAVVGGGATITSLPISLEDAQFVEAKKFGIEEVARIFDVPPTLLYMTEYRNAQTTEQELLRLLTFSLRPRMVAFEDGLERDLDLFGVGSTIYPEFIVNTLDAVDAITRAEVEHYQVQDGTRLKDEVRANSGYGPLPPLPDDPTKEPGKVPLLTPVGAAPNPDKQPPAVDEPID